MFDINGKYSALKEVMYYYHYNFYAYYFLASVVLINCIKVVMDYVHIKNGRTEEGKSSYYDIFLSILSGGGLFTGMIFHGILTDIPNSQGHEWFNKTFILSIIAFVLFIIQIVFYNRNSEIRSKKVENQ